jgi:PBP4 family serine-type D-alanyl-D-alanine carboxypeptidase
MKTGMARKNIINAFGLLTALMFAFGCASRGKTAAPGPYKFPVNIDDFQSRRETLGRSIDSILSDTLLFQANSSVYIIQLDSNKELYSLNRSNLMMPASANKIFVTAAAYLNLGINYRFRTAVFGDSIDPLGKINGDLYLKGYGDPELRAVDLEAMAYRLRAMGLKQVNGDLIVDAVYFDTTSYGFGWMWDEGPYAYNAPISALSLNRNTFEIGIRPGKRPGKRPSIELNPITGYLTVVNQAITVKSGDRARIKVDRAFNGTGDEVSITGSVAMDERINYLVRTVTNPPLYCGTVFREALARSGIKILGSVRTGISPLEKSELTWHASPPLYQIIRNMNKESDNFTAEMIYRQLSNGWDSLSADSSQKNKIVEMLNSMGFGDESFRIADGSGLSRYNLCSAGQLVKVLTDVYAHPALRPELLVSLPIAGIDGTLSKRLMEDEYQGRVRAKTGTLTGVSSLAGFVFGPQGKAYCFAVMFNNYTSKANSVRALQDSIIAKLITIAP